MFYPSELLQRSGALARVWMAANVEKKLTKTQVLQDKIDEDISEIMRPRAPFSLRLSGSLLLGVVRIYSRKARYLLDDCSDALWKIKMAFKPGDIDLPTTHLANPAALTLPDAITDIDLLAPMPDPALFLGGSLDVNLNIPDHMADWDSSQFLSTSAEQPRAEVEILDDEDDLGLEFDLDPDQPIAPFDEGTSIERGRDAPLERRASEEFGTDLKDIDDDLGLEFDEDLSEMPPAPEINIEDTDMPMGGTTELEPELEESTMAGEPALARERSMSPLSELGEAEERALEQEVHNTSVFQPEQEQDQDQDEEEVEHQARAKRRRLIQQDTQTQLSSTEIRAQQNNRDSILRPSSFLPRDPLLMTLMNLQKSGGFVSSILGDGRSQGWAPELRGILSLEVVSRPSQKRKRDSGIADVETADDQANGGAEKTPQLEFEQDEPLLDTHVDIGGDTSLAQEEQEVLPALDEGVGMPQEDEEDFSAGLDRFEDTTFPLLHPAESGVVSLETKHAVHMLRQVFGDAAETSEEERVNTAVSFQGMFPENNTTKADVARMFNEVLVLATKDAIKVEQQQPKENALGGLIKIRAKRGLWGSWAETDVSGAEAIKAAEAREAAQATQASASATAPPPSTEIAVEA